MGVAWVVAGAVSGAAFPCSRVKGAGNRQKTNILNEKIWFSGLENV
jgi:hypothetical protein